MAEGAGRAFIEGMKLLVLGLVIAGAGCATTGQGVVRAAPVCEATIVDVNTVGTVCAARTRQEAERAAYEMGLDVVAGRSTDEWTFADRKDASDPRGIWSTSMVAHRKPGGPVALCVAAAADPASSDGMRESCAGVVATEMQLLTMRAERAREREQNEREMRRLEAQQAAIADAQTSQAVLRAVTSQPVQPAPRPVITNCNAMPGTSSVNCVSY